MKTNTFSSSPAVAVWDHVMHFDESMSPAAARALLKVQFPPQDLARMQELAAKARRSDLTVPEAVEIDTFERMGCLLDILHSQARRVLRRPRQTA
jgi:hypothetical protein